MQQHPVAAELPRTPVRSRGAGFTIVELLVVCGVISVLISLLMPAVQSARESARRVSCKSNLRQIAVGLHNYESDFRMFPPGSQVQGFTGSQPYSKSIGWTIAILPYVEQQSLYSQFDFSLDAQIHHREQTSRRVPLFSCPSDPVPGPIDWIRPGGPDPIWARYYEGGWGTTNYLGVCGTSIHQPVLQPTDCSRIDGTGLVLGLHSGIFFGNSNIRFADVTDGTSSTFLCGERGVTLQWGKWGGSGLQNHCPMGLTDVVLPGIIEGAGDDGGIREARGDISDRTHWWSWHPGGTHFALVDSSVQFVSTAIDRNVVRALSTRSGGEVIDQSW